MKLSTRSRYGLRLMFELAVHENGTPVQLKEIAARQEISEKYLSKLVIPLKSAGLVLSERGHHGGYRLGRDPAVITVKDVLSVLEGELSPVPCIKDQDVCGKTENCSTRNVWAGLERVITEYLESVTLEAIVEESREKTVMYYI